MKQRIRDYDVMKGVASLIMIVANGTPLIHEDHPVAFRIICSLAAPMFLLVSGFTFNALNRRVDPKPYWWLRQSAKLAIVAALIDTFLWRSMPFYTFDVLYVMSAGVLVNAALRRVPATMRLLLAAMIWLIPYVIYPLIPYRQTVEVVQVLHVLMGQQALNLESPLRAAFIDGWFPVLPWIALPIIGNAVKDLRDPDIMLRRPTILAASFAAHGALLMKLPAWSVLPLREGYSVIFYPCDPLTFLFLLCVSVLLVAGIQSAVSRGSVPEWLSVFGQYSLDVYVVHQVLFELIHSVHTETFAAGEFAVASACVIGACVAYTMVRIKVRLRRANA